MLTYRLCPLSNPVSPGIFAGAKLRLSFEICKKKKGKSDEGRVMREEG